MFTHFLQQFVNLQNLSGKLESFFVSAQSCIIFYIIRCLTFTREGEEGNLDEEEGYVERRAYSVLHPQHSDTTCSPARCAIFLFLCTVHCNTLLSSTTNYTKPYFSILFYNILYCISVLKCIVYYTVLNCTILY